MIIQKTVIKDDGYASLYFRGGNCKEGYISIAKGERLSFDTYFNSFTYTKYRRFTKLGSISYRARVEGGAILSLYIAGHDGDVKLSECRGEGEISLSVDIDALPEGAFLYPALEALEDAKFIRGSWESDITPSEDISVAIAICTYKREEYLNKNIGILCSSDIRFLDKIIVVDNGNTLNPENYGEKRISIYKNPNYGGSAGFTRGIIEAKAGGFSHVILMDDDIVIFPEAIDRMTAFLSILKDECKNAHISAAMLPTSDIKRQHEMGALWNGSHIESLGHNLDVSTREALLANLEDGDIRYGAWWCFCLPISDVCEFGLPLPLFIKFDDVEYGTRCCGHAPIVTMSGMAVAHADFDLKYNMYLDYYTIRNQLIMLACHKKQGTLGCLVRLMKVSAKHFFMYRYEAAPIIIRAFRDFLKGAEFINSTDAEELNRSVMKMNPPPTNLSDIPGWCKDIRADFKEKARSPLKILAASLTLGGHIFPSFLLSKKVSFAPLPTAKVYDCFLRATTVQYQLGSDTGYVFKKSSLKFFRVMLSLARLSIEILTKYKKAARSYRKAFPHLTSEAFWQSYLGLGNKQNFEQMKF